MALRDDFKAAVSSAVRECYTIGYIPKRFEQMITEAHPVEVAKHLVVSGTFQYGIRELNRLERLDLSIEHLMLRPQFAPLFTAEQLAAAEWRLDNIPAGREP